MYKNKSIKAEIRALQPTSDSIKTPKKIKEEEEAIKKRAEGAAVLSESHLQKHIILARAVTLLQISIAISAIAILTRRRFMWWIAMAIALGGVSFLIEGVI